MRVHLDPDAPAPDMADAPPDDGAFADVPPAVAVIDLGLLGVLGGRTGAIMVETQSLGAMQIVVVGHPGAHVILEQALDPDGAVIISSEEPDDLSVQELAYARGFPGPVFSLNRVLPQAQSGAFLVPNTPSVAPRDGTWVLRIGQYAVDLEARPPTRTPVDRPVRVFVVARPPAADSGRIALNVHKAGLGPLSTDDAFIREAVDVAADIWSAAGIAFDAPRVLQVPLPPGAVTLAGPSCEGGGLDALMASASGAPAGIDLFVVDRFTCVLESGVEVGGSIGGLAAGMPGPAWLRGSRRGGVAVATESAFGDARLLGTVVAHELAHLLGLFHTRESGGGQHTIHDEIPDSPDGDDSDENLMYFAVGSETRLSPGQAEVLRTSPWVMEP